MIKKSFILCAVILLPATLYAQLTGEVRYDELGISFTIPTGWIGQELEDMVVLGSNSVPGMVVITTHENSLEELKAEARQGYSEGPGTQLRLEGELTELSETALGGVFTGTIEGQDAKAYMIAVVNPYEGPGVTIMSATLPHMYTGQHRDTALGIFRSLKFREVTVDEDIQDWINFLTGVRLTYMDSYSSSGDGGYSSEEMISLCTDRTFNFGSNSVTTLGGSGISGYSTSAASGDGQWSIVRNSAGDPTLILNYHNGKVSHYTLSYEDEKTYLDGYRYFRTTEGEYAPYCN